MIIGLTGTIASGKSTASRELKRLGAVVLDADVFSREAVAKGSPALELIRERFGDGALLPSGELDRRAVAGIVFSDEAKRRELNGIIHPAVLGRLFSGTRDALADDPDAAVIWDVPLLIECGWERYTDEVWLITAPLSVRTARIMARDGASEEAALARIKAQMTDEDKRRAANVVIENDSGEAEFIKKIDALYAQTVAR